MSEIENVVKLNPPIDQDERRFVMVVAPDPDAFLKEIETFDISKHVQFEHLIDILHLRNIGKEKGEVNPDFTQIKPALTELLLQGQYALFHLGSFDSQEEAVKQIKVDSLIESNGMIEVMSDFLDRDEPYLLPVHTIGKDLMVISTPEEAMEMHGFLEQIRRHSPLVDCMAPVVKHDGSIQKMKSGNIEVLDPRYFNIFHLVGKDSLYQKLEDAGKFALTSMNTIVIGSRRAGCKFKIFLSSQKRQKKLSSKKDLSKGVSDV